MSDPNATAEVYQRLTERLKDMVHDEHRNGMSGAERFTVLTVDPLVLGELAGDVILEDGDPDFTLGSWLQQYMANYALEAGDLIWCVRDGLEWHAIDVAEPGTIAALGGGGDGGGGGNIDGGHPDSVYGGLPLIDAGGV